MTYEDIINYEALAVYDSQIKKWVKELTPQHTEEIYNLLLSHLGDGYRLKVNELQPDRPSRTLTAVYEYICNVEIDGELYLRWDRFGIRNIKTMNRDRLTVFTSINHEIGSDVFVIDEDGEFVIDSSKKVKEYGSFTFASKEDLENINLEPITDEEIIAMWMEDPEVDNVGVTIDGEPRSLDPMFMYKEQGYPVLYYEESGTLPPESMMCSDERPNEDDERYTHYEQVGPEPEPTLVNVTIDGDAQEVDSNKTYAENGYSAIYKNNDAADATADYPQEGDVLVTDPNVVDLGLSVLWCRTNLGAASPTEVGKYFAWKKLEGFYPDAQGYFEGRYFFWDYYPSLTASDDPVADNSLNAYRMPTEAEWDELIAASTISKNGNVFELSCNGRTLIVPQSGSAYGGQVQNITQTTSLWTNFRYNSGFDPCVVCFYSTVVRKSVAVKEEGYPIRGVKPIQNNN